MTRDIRVAADFTLDELEAVATYQLAHILSLFDRQTIAGAADSVVHVAVLVHVHSFLLAHADDIPSTTDDALEQVRVEIERLRPWRERLETRFLEWSKKKKGTTS